MKIFFLLLLFIFLPYCNQAQNYNMDNVKLINNDSTKLYIKKVKSYQKMKKTGNDFLKFGIVSTFLGVLVAFPSDIKIQNSTLNNNPLGGYILMSIGGSMLTTGYILNRIGNSKIRKYEDKLNRISLNVDYIGKQKGFALTYRF